GKSTRTREADVIGAQHLEHFRAYEALDQRHLEKTERDGGKDQRLQARGGEKPGGPPADHHGVATAERRQPAKIHGKNHDQQDADEERRKRHPDERESEERMREPGIAS